MLARFWWRWVDPTGVFFVPEWARPAVRREVRRAMARALVRFVVVKALLLAIVLLADDGSATAAPRSEPSEASWTWPLGGEPQVGRGFAPPAQRYGRGHRGVDLLGSPGAPVLAAGSGSVSYAGLLAGRGVVVVVHGELRTTYEPVTASVAVGQQVVAGQPIGTLEPGHAGCRVVACLHWGLRRGEAYLDPLSLVAGGPPRLLPLGPAAGGGAARAAPGPVLPPRSRVDPVPAGAPVAPIHVPGEAGAAAGAAAPAPNPPERGRTPGSVVTPAGAASAVAVVAGAGLLAQSGRRSRRHRAV